MHLFMCLTSLVLTFHVSSSASTNYTLQNVPETNKNQSISYDDILENVTSLDAASDTNTSNAKELEISRVNVKELETSSFNAKELETSSVNAKELETSSTNAKKLETSRVNAKELETSSVNSKELETSSVNAKELETSSISVVTTEFDPAYSLTTFSHQNITSNGQIQTNEPSYLPSVATESSLLESSIIISPVPTSVTESRVPDFTSMYPSSSTTQNEVTENIDFKIENQTTEERPSSIKDTAAKFHTVTTKVSTVNAPPIKINAATLQYESDKNHDELILSGVFQENREADIFQAEKNQDVIRDDHISFSNAKISPTVFETASVLSITPDNITSFEETVEHNAILTTDFEAATDKTQSIIVGHKCTRIFQESILWNVTDGGMLALKTCPPGYQGNMYRPCFSNGKWGNVDYSECRLEHLGRMRHMIFHQVQKGMLGNMYVLADEFSKYISSVDMKSPMDRLEAFEILNTFLKLDMSLKMDKSRDIKYIQTLLYSCNELIKKKTVLFSPGSQKNRLITEKAVEMVFDLTYFAEKALRGLLKTQKKQVAFRSTSNVVLYLYRGKLSRQFPLMNFSSDYERDDELSSYFNLEKTLERSAYALIWVKGLHDLLSMDNLLVNSDVAVATILSPLNSLNHLLHPPTFDIGLRMRKAIPEGYTLKCGQLYNMTQSAKLTEYLDIPTGRWFNTRSTQNLWNTEDCMKANRKGDIVTCRCHHLGSIALLLEEEPQSTSNGPSPPVGKLITVSCVTSLSATVLTLVINFLLKRRDQSLSIFILINLLVCLASIQITFMLGVNKTDRFEICLSFAVLLHYLFLVSCFWVVSYSIYLLQRLRSSMEYVGKIRDYCVFCWLLPTILLIISFVGNPNGYETKQFCWLNVQRGILWSFVIPVTGLILVNTIVMILALKTFNEQMSVTHRVEICKTRNAMRAGITLLPFFAINWFFGILAVEDSENMSLQVIFSLTNSMQGILTFVFFCVMDNNVQMLFRLKFHEASRKPKVSAMKLKKSGSFPILERPLITLTDDNRRNDCTPLLSQRTTYTESSEDPCCSNIRV